VIVRLAMSDRENKRLLDQVRTDSLTGLGNRGLMQVELERLCQVATPDRPSMVVFLDLNGFKHLNDTRGHHAGDETLARLGRRLRDAVSAHGTAYRAGGDEFCVLLSCPAERFDAATKRATEALTESGPGYSVGTAWGAATIPDEAQEPLEALRLADVRMYAQKESRRVTQSGPVDLPAVPAPQPSVRGR
jgi:two-component system, cell cycle response regulator